MASMWDMPMLPGENTSGFSALPPRQKPERAPPEDPWRVQPGFGAARNRKLNSDASFSILVRTCFGSLYTTTLHRSQHCCADRA